MEWIAITGIVVAVIGLGWLGVGLFLRSVPTFEDDEY